jgi:hypothetical protein
LKGHRFLWFEFWLIVIVIAIAAAVAERTCAATVTGILNSTGGTFYGTLAQSAAGLFGFVVAAISIALTLAQDAKFRHFRESSQYQTLWAIFGAATWPLGLATLFGFVGLFFVTSRLFLYVTAFLCALSAARLVHVVRTLFAMTNALAVMTKTIEKDNRELARDAE